MTQAPSVHLDSDEAGRTSVEAAPYSARVQCTSCHGSGTTGEHGCTDCLGKGLNPSAFARGIEVALNDAYAEGRKDQSEEDGELQSGAQGSAPAAWLREEWNGTGSRSVQLDAPPAVLPLREQAIGVRYTPLYRGVSEA